ncbi:MAG: hypothetical protein MUE82_08045 [Chloroflexi bacterium]|jgi:hypothetical protein|nr:hypothetical protein [Chloroflexota bacterium]
MNDYPLTFPRKRADLYTVPMVASRERYHFLAAYYAWCARKGFPPGARDPLTGRDWSRLDPASRRLGRAAYIALAREAYAIARSYGPSPLP